jgi:thiamine biosynthesis protein ThiS
MKVYVNGEARELGESATVADLLQAVDAPAAGIAVEVNQVLVRRAQHGEHALVEGDRVEIVGLVGGG